MFVIINSLVASNCHHHNNYDINITLPCYHFTLQIRKAICEWLAWALRMSRPGKDLSRQFLLRKARMRELEARTPPSISLLSNVKDVDNAIPLNDFPPVSVIFMLVVPSFYPSLPRCYFYCCGTSLNKPLHTTALGSYLCLDKWGKCHVWEKRAFFHFRICVNDKSLHPSALRVYVDIFQLSTNQS